jgi:serine/threonine-protein kinase
VQSQGAAEFGATLGGAYRIERELGRGGMATVYLAEDIKHGRMVALKVLHVDLAANLGPERFRREITTVAKLQHPHILTVLDSGQSTAGRLWFTMPFVEGEALRTRLVRDRQLAVDDAVRIAREVALALEYAHRHGVIHRDIKPENILLTADGQALVADFGIARALAPEASATTSLTETGLALGTPQYMSPEQATADRAVGPATDVYSLGAMLYEMLAGEPPFTGPTAQAIIARMMSGDVPSVRRTRPSVPDAIDAGIRKAMAPVAADRFASAGDFAKVLDAAGRTTAAAAAPARVRRPLPVSLLMLMLGVLLGGGALFAWRHRTGQTGDAGGMPTIAVLPFENVGDSADAYFADGITDEIRGKLSGLSGMQVIASGSSTQYKRSTKPQETIARELGAQYLLVGRVRWQKHPGGASRVRVDPELVHVAEGHAPQEAWQQNFDADLSDVFAVQSDIATKVAAQLRVTLGGREQQALTSRPTDNLAAYDALLRGEEITKQGVGPVVQRQATTAFLEAVRLDSTFAQAWGRLSLTYSARYANGVPSPALADSSRAAATRALALAPSASLSHRAMAGYYLNVAHDRPRAYSEDSIAVADRPSDASTLDPLAIVELALGRYDASIQHFEAAAKLDPRNGQIAGRLGFALTWGRRYDAARQSLERAHLLAPNNPGAVETLAMVALGQGDLPAARAYWRSAQATIDSSALVAYAGNYYDLGWSLDSAQQRFLLTLGAAPFDGDRATQAIVLAQQYYWAGDLARTRVYADSARAGFAEQLRVAPSDAQRRVFHGLALAYLGRNDEARREAERAMAIAPLARDAVGNAYVEHQAARVFIVVGDKDRAVALLRELLATNYYLSPAWLRIDPNFAPLRGDPGFQQLIASH